MSFRADRSAPLPAGGRGAEAPTSAVEEHLRRRLGELAGINALGIALGSTHDLEALADAGLAEIVGRLGFGRALLALVDQEARVIGSCRVAGGPPGIGVLVADLRVPLDDGEAHLAALAGSDGPLLFRDVAPDGHEANRRMAATLGASSYVGTPLVSHGRVVGVLVAEDRRYGRPLEPADGPLLFTAGTLFAGALESARLYATLEAHNRELEARVADRTRELIAAMGEAQEARAAAETANEAKSSFLANVSHELRTPLTSIVGFTKLNRKRLGDVIFPVVTPGDPKVDRAVRQVGETLEIVVAEGERLTGLINDLLDLAKIEAGRFEWHMAPLRLDDVARQALAATAALFEVSGLPLAVEIEPDLPEVSGDRDRLVQVVINLVSNAVKFTTAGGVTVRVTRDGDGVALAVTDTGPGIAPGDRVRVFEPFRQASDTVAGGPRGTGLGLPISRQIVEVHGGTLELESEVGAGSTFRFRIPMATG